MWTASRPTSPRFAPASAIAAPIGPGSACSQCEQVIVNVGQSESDAPWPLRILDHSGGAHDVTLEPGEALFYESARLLHARPEPLQGQWFANVFVHFQPVGWDAEWAAGAARKQLDSCVEGYMDANMSAWAAGNDVFQHLGLPEVPRSPRGDL